MSQSPKRLITSMRLPDDLMQRLAACARLENRSRSNLVEALLWEGVRKRRPTGASAPIVEEGVQSDLFA